MKILIMFLFIFNTFSLAGSYTKQVKMKLYKVKLAAMEQGFEDNTHNDIFDKLREGNSDSFSFRLRKDKKYLIVATCDKDCEDLDLKLYDENHNKVTDDTSTDELPIVQVSPKWTGKFTLKVKMYKCKTNPCYYGFSVLSSNE